VAGSRASAIRDLGRKGVVGDLGDPDDALERGDHLLIGLLLAQHQQPRLL
jgi:hypothetical protein